MSVVVDEARADAAWLRELIDPDAPEVLFDKEDHERLERIASTLEMFSNAMFDPGLQLEKEVEEYMANVAKHEVVGVDGPGPHSELLAALWLIQRRLANLGTRALTGNALSGLGAGAVAAMLGGALGKEKEKEKK